MYEPTIDEMIVNLLKGSGAKLNEVWLDVAPAGAEPPYVTYNGNNTTTPALRGDGKTSRYQREFQFDYWDRYDSDDVDNIRLLREALNGTLYVLRNNEHGYVEFVNAQRVPEPFGSQLAHHMFTGTVRHSAQVG